METLEISSVGIDIRGRSRNIGVATAKVLVWEAEPGSSSKIWGGITHIQSVSNSVCCAKLDSISNSLALVREDVREDGGV